MLTVKFKVSYSDTIHNLISTPTNAHT